MKKIEIKLSHSTVTGLLVAENSSTFILSNVTVYGIKDVRHFDSWGVPKNMCIYYTID